MNIHISIKNENLRVFLQKLPKKEPSIKETLKTSSGIVKHQTIANGKKVLTDKKFKNLSYKSLNLENPEIDINKAGRIINNEYLTTAYHKPNELKITQDFKKFKISLDANEKITEKTIEKATHSNINELSPLIVNLETNIPIKEAFTRFAFKDIYQLIHKDEHTRKHLIKLAKILQESNSCVLLGSGKKGKDPIILQENGTPCRGFIFGEIKNSKYKLLVMITDMEMKTIQEIEVIKKTIKK